jgi:putative MFS transporter
VPKTDACRSKWLMPAETGIRFHHPPAFWLGTTAVMVGVLLHFPMFLEARAMGTPVSEMPMSSEMLVGMYLIIAGLIAATYGLFPRGAIRRRGSGGGDVLQARFKAMDAARLTPAHWGLLTVLGFALIIDVMKPATLGFVIPGTMAEYHITTRQVAVLPLVALAGTTVGSFMWGMLADLIGRRASILLASLLFMATSVCGFMPTFAWNVFMCFTMGIAAGGMLPIVYALMSESVPARRRGWLVVLHAGVGTVCGYLAASGAAAVLEPIYTWRILWIIGLPTGAILLILNRWIPESPRFLLAWGRDAEAQRVMARYGVTMVAADAPETADRSPAPAMRVRSGALLELFRTPYLGRTMTVGAYALSWGLVNWGFLTFLPAVLRTMGYPAGSASRILFQSALLALPGTLIVAWLYGCWSSKNTMVIYGGATAAILAAFAVLHVHGTGDRLLLTILMGALFVSTNGVIAMISPYTSEIYPTQLRGTGSGFAAGSSKFGGILGPLLAASVLTGPAAGLARIALFVAVPMALSAVTIAAAGRETRDRRLEELVLQPTAGAE